MSLLSTPDGNKNFLDDEDYLRYIEEKCGYEVAQEVRSVFCVFDIVDDYDGEICDLTYDIDEFLGDNCAVINSNPISKIKELKHRLDEATLLLERAEKKLDSILKVL